MEKINEKDMEMVNGGVAVATGAIIFPNVDEMDVNAKAVLDGEDLKTPTRVRTGAIKPSRSLD